MLFLINNFIPMQKNENAIFIANKTKAIRAKFEPYIIAVSLIAVVLKTQHVPSIGIIIVFSITALSTSSFLSAFETQDVDDSIDPKLIYFINYLRGWGLSILYLGIMFSIQNWPGNKPMLVSGTTIIIAVLFLEKYKNLTSQKSLLRIILVVIGIAFLVSTQQKLYDIGIIHSIREMHTIR
jgi:hypothetical protein